MRGQFLHSWLLSIAVPKNFNDFLLSRKSDNLFRDFFEKKIVQTIVEKDREIKI
jgi:hypothetical protein